MSESGTLGLLLILALVFLAAVVIGRLPVRTKTRRLLLVGLALRVLGGLVYLALIGGYYGGGDYLLYFREGSELAHSAVHRRAGFDLGPGDLDRGAVVGDPFRQPRHRPALRRDWPDAARRVHRLLARQLRRDRGDGAGLPPRLPARPGGALLRLDRPLPVALVLAHRARQGRPRAVRGRAGGARVRRQARIGPAGS